MFREEKNIVRHNNVAKYQFNSPFLQKSRSSHWRFRSNYWTCSVRNGVLKNFANFTGKQLCRCLFYKVASLQPASFLTGWLLEATIVALR